MDDLAVDEGAINGSNGPMRGREEPGNFLLEIQVELAFFCEFSDGFGRGWEPPPPSSVLNKKSHRAQKKYSRID